MATPEAIDVDHWVHLGRVIRDARVADGLTQHALAARAGVSRSWLARVESGHRKAEIEFLMRTLAALNLAFAVGPATPPDVDPAILEALREAGLE